MTRIMVALPEMGQYKQVVILDRPGIVYVNISAREGANMVLILPDLQEKVKSM